MGKFKLEHIRSECIGCGVCAAVAEEFWTMDEGSGEKSDIKHEKKPTNKADGSQELMLEEKNVQINKDAAEACPVNCIHLYDENGKKMI
jgi:ferredoxin